MEDNDIIHPAIDPTQYVNLDEMREGYAPVKPQGWDILTQNLRSEAAPEQPAADRGRRQRPRGSVGERRYLRRHGLI
ncbi:hypothetical protein FMI35_08900 [Escherichia coli]|uniref:hypothetical protein n=1 Tax=Escherichia coli TaxID=562 RepID=UPI000BEFAEAE|nr:hypothetical protein [Escherichia coli]EEW0682991.1 hypothetical protein [Escherichia coli]EEW2321952.1 hypothetical protein [Escherichia coli]EFB3062510.1 hypothetical protein [Escherichia coli]EFH8015972.1 hypothetical protein [Escherichia coli]EFL6948756.1 hypothetical protein [Escherichia coli]